jgi:hypothetical protein
MQAEHRRRRHRRHRQTHPRPVVYIAHIVQVPRPTPSNTVKASPPSLQVELHNPQTLVGHEVVQNFWEIVRQMNLPSIGLILAVLDNWDDKVEKEMHRGWRFSSLGASFHSSFELESSRV